MATRRALLLFCLLLIVGAWQSMRIGASSSTVLGLPPDWLSPRPIQSCFQENDVPDSCFDGGIRGLDVSVDGQVAVFESDGNRFVAGDKNRRSDIFLWQAGSVQRVSVDANGEEGDHASDRAALSGNGRYLYFRSQAGNWVAGTQRGRLNLYLKEVASGRLALISRDLSGAPVNVENASSHFDQLDADYSGRYAVFSSDYAAFVEEVSDTNQVQDLFFVDVDPDGNGDYFDSAPRIYLLSALADGTATGNGASFDPSISMDGSAVVWRSRATDLAPGTESNGNGVDVLLAQFGKLSGGSIDPGTRTLVAINRMGDDAETLTPQGVSLARIDPWHGQVAFVTADDIPGTGDDHAGYDVYLSTESGEDSDARQTVWVSHAYSTTQPDALSIVWDPILPASALRQVAWVGQASPRTVDDLLLERTAPFHPAGWATVNWLEAATPSSEPVTGGVLSTDGRFAFWVTAESYGLEVPAGSSNLFRRAIAPAHSVPLTVSAVGGRAKFAPAGLLIDGTMHYSSTVLVTLAAEAEAGYRFREWAGVDASAGLTATALVYTARTVTASFDAMTPPMVDDLTVTLAEDAPPQLVPLAIIDPDPDEQHTLAVAEAPAHGTAMILDNSIHYQPAPDFNGQDSFAVQVTDAYSLSLAQAALVTVVVTPVNDAPVAATAHGSGVNNGSVISVLVSVQDVDADDSFTLAVETPPMSGSVRSGTLPEAGEFFEYRPEAEFGGVDTFTFRATDSGSASITGTATVTVTRVLTPTVPTPVATSELLLPALRRSRE